MHNHHEGIRAYDMRCIDQYARGPSPQIKWLWPTAVIKLSDGCCCNRGLMGHMMTVNLCGLN